MTDYTTSLIHVELASFLVSYWPGMDQGIGRPSRLPPLIKTMGWSWLREAVCFRHRGEVSLSSL